MRALDFQALVEDPTRLTRLNESGRDRPFAMVAARLLKRLGGRHAELARRILEETETETISEPGPAALPPEPKPAVKAVLRRTLSSNVPSIERLSWSPDGAWLALRSFGGGLSIMSVAGTENDFVPPDGIDSLSVSGATWSPDSQWVAFGMKGGDLRVWGVAQKSVVATAEVVPKGTIGYLAWSPDGGVLAVGTWDDTGSSVHLMTIRGPGPGPSSKGGASVVQPVFSDPNHVADPGEKIDLPSKALSHLAWSSDGRCLAAICDFSTIHLIERATLAVSALDHPPLGSHGMAWWPDSAHLAGFQRSGTVWIWDANRRDVVRRIDNHLPRRYSYTGWASVSSDGRLLAVFPPDDSVRIWRCDTWEIAGTIGFSSSVDHLPCLAFNPRDSRVLATVGRGGEVLLWDLDISDALGPPSFVPDSSFPGSETTLPDTTWEAIRSLRRATDPPEPWVGRPELVEVVAKLTASRDLPIRVGLFGPKGSGKTALAAKAAADPAVRAAFPDGVLWFNLRSSNDLTAVLTETLGPLGLSGPSVDIAGAPEAIMDRFASILAGKRWLLVADEVPNLYAAGILLRLRAPATLLVAPPPPREIFEAWRLHESEVVRIEPLPKPEPVDELDVRRLLLFAPAPNSFSLDAAVEVLGKGEDEGAQIVTALERKHEGCGGSRIGPTVWSPALP